MFYLGWGESVKRYVEVLAMYRLYVLASTYLKFVLTEKGAIYRLPYN